MNYFADRIDVTEEYERYVRRRGVFWLVVLALFVGVTAYSYWFDRAGLFRAG